MIMVKIFFSSLLFVLSTSIMAESLDGIWRLSDKPVWITIESDVGLVSFSENDPDARGKMLLRDLKMTEAGTRWQGQIYVKQLKAYRDASIVLTSADSMEINVKVGFIRRTVEWSRDTEIPALVD